MRAPRIAPQSVPFTRSRALTPDSTTAALRSSRCLGIKSRRFIRASTNKLNVHTQRLRVNPAAGRLRREALDAGERLFEVSQDVFYGFDAARKSH